MRFVRLEALKNHGERWHLIHNLRSPNTLSSGMSLASSTSASVKSADTRRLGANQSLLDKVNIPAYQNHENSRRLRN
jgi:hypothetical protein